MFAKKNSERFAIVYRDLNTFVLTNGIFTEAERNAMIRNPNIWIYTIRELGA